MSIEAELMEVLTYLFRKVTGVTSTEVRLRDLGIPYNKERGGRLVVPGDIDFSNTRYIALPDLSGVDVRGNYNCANNFLSTLEGAPQSVGGHFYCHNNQLTSLEHAPQIFQKLGSDFGEFSSWSEVPDEIRVSLATKARHEKEREYAFAEGATVLQAPMKAMAPLKLRL